MAAVKRGFAPTRRIIFSAQAAVEYADYTRNKLRNSEQFLREMDVDFVDINDMAADGLFHDDNDRCRIEEKLKREKVDGLLVPHGNFGGVCHRKGAEEIRRFLAVCNVVRTFRNIRILKIGLRPLRRHHIAL